MKIEGSREERRKPSACYAYQDISEKVRLDVPEATRMSRRAASLQRKYTVHIFSENKMKSLIIAGVFISK